MILTEWWCLLIREQPHFMSLDKRWQMTDEFTIAIHDVDAFTDMEIQNIVEELLGE